MGIWYLLAVHPHGTPRQADCVFDIFGAYPCHIAKQTVIAGLKCPPLVGAQVMMAKAIPIAKAQPIWKMDPKVTGDAPVAFKYVEATDAIPGNT